MNKKQRFAFGTLLWMVFISIIAMGYWRVYQEYTGAIPQDVVISQEQFKMGITQLLLVLGVVNGVGISLVAIFYRFVYHQVLSKKQILFLIVSIPISPFVSLATTAFSFVPGGGFMMIVFLIGLILFFKFDSLVRFWNHMHEVH